MRLCLVIVLVFYMSTHVRLMRCDHKIPSVLFCAILSYSVIYDVSLLFLIIRSELHIISIRGD